MKKNYLLKTRPQAVKENILRWGDYRITVLTDRLFRVEKSDEGVFEDKATQAVLFRDMPAVVFSVEENNGILALKTEKVTLFLNAVFEESYIEVEGNCYQLSESENLLGTYRTLDGFEGNRCMCEASSNHEGDIMELNNGVCAKNGFAILDDNSFVFGENSLIPRSENVFDKYIFAYGKEYRAALKAFYELEGFTPLVPRFALGNWWSRYYPYSERTYLQLLNKFKENRIPLSVAVIDMDWHYAKNIDEIKGITASGRNSKFYGGNNGWTGFSWNTELFADPQRFVTEVKDKGLYVSLNLHPADGIRWWEDSYEEFATNIGIEPTTYQHIPFDITDDAFVENYFNVVLRPHEEIGVDFWWIDWQQGNKCKIPGLDPLWLLNHYHYIDQEQKTENPLILSRYCGAGAHRYPLGFSGDTYVSWKTLQYLPYFTATSTNIGYTWWSHDIGGHFEGYYDSELYVRFLQFGCFSPINRLHSCDNPTLTKEPWFYLNGRGDIGSRYLRLRHSLVPLLYTASYRTAKEGRALIEPMYYEYPNEENAYKFKNQYTFAEQMLVAPIINPAKGDYGKVRVWLPKGEWTDFFTSEQYHGGRVVTVRRTLDDIPVFVKEGGIIPLAEDIDQNGCPLPEILAVRIYEGDGAYTLYENDGERVLWSAFTSKQLPDGKEITFSLQGDASVMPKNRRVKFVFINVEEGEVQAFANGESVALKEVYADHCTYELSSLQPDVVYTIRLQYQKRTTLERLQLNCKRILTGMFGSNTAKWDVYNAVQACKTVAEAKKYIKQDRRMTEEVKKRILEIL